MAIYHCSMKIISQETGKSAVTAAAYKAGQTIMNKYDRVTHDYNTLYEQLASVPAACNDIALRLAVFSICEKKRRVLIITFEFVSKEK